MFGFTPADFGVMGIFAAAAVVFFAFIGFDIVATAAEETRNPQRDVPRGILGSLAICTVLYVAVSVVVTGMQKYTKLSTDAPLADAFKDLGHPFFAGLISFGAAVGLTSVCMILLLGQSRVFFAMSRDGLLPRVFSRVHPRFGTPYRSTLLLGGVVAVVAGFTSSTNSPNWSTSAPCSRSWWSPSAWSCCAAPAPTCRGPSAPRWCRWSRCCPSSPRCG